MRFSTTLALISLALTTLPVFASHASHASQLIRRDDENNVYVGYYDGDMFVGRTIELERVDKILMGIVELIPKNPKITNGPIGRRGPGIFDKKGSEKSAGTNAYYAEILRGPPSTKCRFLSGPVDANFLNALKKGSEEVPGPWITEKVPFIPYNGHIADAHRIFCIARGDDSRDNVNKEDKSSPSSPKTMKDVKLPDFGKPNM